MKDISPVAVVIPVYKSSMNAFELASFKRCLEVLSLHPIILISPEGLDLSEFLSLNPKLEIIRFNPRYFKSIASYNKLMMAPFFYKAFLSFEYILIYQLDVFVFRDELDAWCKKGYDYIGAPWVDANWIYKLKKKIKIPVDKIINRVGNGGFSLRKVKTFYSLSKWFKPVAFFWPYNEDFFWSTFVARLSFAVKTPQWKEALAFGFEDNPAKSYELNNFQLPFGCHAWEKYDIDFWRPIFEKHGYKI